MTVSSGVRAFVGLGSNLGDRRAHLEAALAALAATPGVAVSAVSPAYENPPVGGPPQDDFWNAVAEVRTTMSPRALWGRLRGIEDAGGRVRTVRDGPRTIDLDLLAHGEHVASEVDLVLPHPRALDRAFTVGPWADVAPEARVAGTGVSVLVHAARLRGRDPAAFAGLRRIAHLALPPAANALPPIVLDDRGALEVFRAGVEGTLGFVPTMGALHEGHASLLRRARASCDAVVASIFVNPLQFGPAEDFSRYPRTFEADLALLAREGVDAVYAPARDDLYPPGFASHVDVAGVTQGYEGAARPGHFRGVATVVTKLLLRVRPDRTWFGQKDAQQVAVVRRMAADLDLPGEILVSPTVREVDGLALSSRNRYLGAADRELALSLSRALAAARDAAARGERKAATLERLARTALAGAVGVDVAYVAVVDPDSFGAIQLLGPSPALLVVAAKVGTTRLIDNEWMTLGTPIEAPP